MNNFNKFQFVLQKFNIYRIFILIIDKLNSIILYQFMTVHQTFIVNSFFLSIYLNLTNYFLIINNFEIKICKE